MTSQESAALRAAAAGPRRPGPVSRQPVGGASRLLGVFGASRWNSRPAWVLGWLVSAGWAGSFPLTSALPAHRLWGTIAAAGYLLAAGAAARLPVARARFGSALVALTGAVVLPLLLLALTGQAQSEVTVIERSAHLLLHTGSPYLAHPHQVTDYTPYLPGMALLGLPRAVLGHGNPLTVLLGDARLWCAAVLLGCLAAGRRVLRTDTPDSLLAGHTADRSWYATVMTALTASPILALPISVSGVDLPLIGVCCLGLALVVRGRPVAAGIVLALACSLKWTAWPAVPVALAALAALFGARAALRCAGVTLAGATALILPSALIAPHAMADQVLAFPTGRAAIRTPAGSPLPGHLLAESGPAGWACAVTLLALGAVALAVSLVRRPPLGAVACADRLALGLAVAFTLAPASRFGYFALPLMLSLWTRLACTSRTEPRPQESFPPQEFTTCLLLTAAAAAAPSPTLQRS